MHYAEIQNSEVAISYEDLTLFKTSFGINKPDYLHIIDYSHTIEDSEGYYAVKAAVSGKHVKKLTDEFSNDENTQLNKYHFTRRPINDDFGKDLMWWNIDSEMFVASYNIQLENDTYGSAAVTITKADGINYVYLWYTNPAMVAK